MTGDTYEAYKRPCEPELLKLVINENVFLFITQNLFCASSMEKLPASVQAIYFISHRNKVEVGKEG